VLFIRDAEGALLGTLRALHVTLKALLGAAEGSFRGIYLILQPFDGFLLGKVLKRKIHILDRFEAFKWLFGFWSSMNGSV
jgi:hypothetical protein